MPHDPSRRTVLSLAVLVVLVGGGGCLGTSEECPPTITPVPYPDHPEDLTSESVRSFASDVERAHAFRDVVAMGGVVNFSFNPLPENVTQVDNGWRVRFSTSNAPEVCNDGHFSSGVADYSVLYFINESVVYRVELETFDSTVQPRNEGTRIRLDQSDNATSTSVRAPEPAS